MGKAAYLYVIADGSGAHKVGLSVSPQRRLRELQGGSPRRLRVARQTPAPAVSATKVEAYAHWLLREACALGEWFNVTEEAAWVALVAAAEAVARGEAAPRRISGPGRPPLSQKSATQPTMVRLTTEVRARIVGLVGATGMAAFIREAIEEKLAATESQPSRKPSSARERTKPKPD